VIAIAQTPRPFVVGPKLIGPPTWFVAPAIGVTACLSFVGALVGLGLPGVRLNPIPEVAS